MAWALAAHHPRLILEIPRGSERCRQLYCLRSAAERTNSILKEDNAILRDPPVRSLRRASVVWVRSLGRSILEAWKVQRVLGMVMGFCRQRVKITVRVGGSERLAIVDPENLIGDDED